MGEIKNMIYLRSHSNKPCMIVSLNIICVESMELWGSFKVQSNTYDLFFPQENELFPYQAYEGK